MTVPPTQFGVQLSLHTDGAADPSCPLRLWLSGSNQDGDGFFCDSDQGGYAVTQDLQVVALVAAYPTQAEAEQVSQWLNQDFGHQLCARLIGQLQQCFATHQQAEDYRIAMLLAAISPDDNDVAVPPVMTSRYGSASTPSPHRPPFGCLLPPWMIRPLATGQSPISASLFNHGLSR